MYDNENSRHIFSRLIISAEIKSQNHMMNSSNVRDRNERPHVATSEPMSSDSVRRLRVLANLVHDVPCDHCPEMRMAADEETVRTQTKREIGTGTRALGRRRRTMGQDQHDPG